MQVQHPQKRSSPPASGDETPAAKEAKYNCRDITALPTEIMVEILSHLDALDLFSCQHVNKRWRKIVVTESALARAFCRDFQPSTSPLGLLRTMASHYPSLRNWLRRFSEQGRKAVIQLDQAFTSQGPYFPEQLFFATANVLEEPKAFHCRKVCTVQHSDKVHGVVFSPDEQHLVTASQDGSIKICHVIDDNWQEVASHSLAHPVHTVSFSQDSKYFIITLSENRHGQIWGRVDEQWQKNADLVHTSPMDPPKFSAEANYLVTRSGSIAAHIYGLVDGRWQPQESGLEGYLVHHTCFHPHDNHLLATTCGLFDQNVTMWRCVNGRWQQHEKLLNNGSLLNISFSPDGRRLVTDSNFPARAYIWHCFEGKWHKEATVDLPDDGMAKASFSLRGDHLATVSRYNTLSLWQRTGNTWGQADLPPPPDICCYGTGHFSPSGLRLVTEQRPASNIRLWRFMDKQWHQETTDPPVTYWLRDARFSVHGNHLVITSPDKYAQIWGVIGGIWQKKATLPYPNHVRESCFSPWGRYVSMVGYNDAVSIWTLNAKENDDVDSSDTPISQLTELLAERLSTVET